MSQLLTLRPKYEQQAQTLETTTFTQIIGKMYDEHNGRCAIGVFLIPGTDYLDDMGRAIPPMIRYEMQRMNDQGKSYKEIAQWLRTLG